MLYFESRELHSPPPITSLRVGLQAPPEEYSPADVAIGAAWQRAACSVWVDSEVLVAGALSTDMVSVPILTGRCQDGAELFDLSGHVRGCDVRGSLGFEGRLVGGGQAQHGADHQRRRADLRLHRPQPDGQV